MTQDTPKASLPPADVSDEALRWIVKLNSGTATAADLLSFQAWRESSEENEAAAKEAENLWTDAGGLYVDFATGIVKPRSRRSGKTRRDIIIGAAGVAVAGSGLWASGVFHDWGADFRTGTAETRVITLPDGSQVTLNARSAINSRFSNSLRRVILLDGQAFFQIAADPARPFQVDARDVVTTAIGTAFDINLNLAEGGVAVSVMEHAVVVDASSKQKEPERIKLTENQSVLVNSDGHIGPVRTLPASVIAAWRTGIYVAENRSLGDVVAALQSYHPGWILIRGNKTAKLRVNAVLNLKRPDESLDALASGLPLTVRRLSPYLVIVSSG